jgi:hypothetical protein
MNISIISIFKRNFYFFLSLTLIFAFALPVGAHNTLTPKVYNVRLAITPPTIDGIINESEWDSAAWDSTDYDWSPNFATTPMTFDPNDYLLYFKLLWSPTSNRLYLLGKIQDDHLALPNHHCKRGINEEDDIEVFMDANHDGGVRHNSTGDAFAYHIASDGYVISPLYVPYTSTNDDNIQEANLSSHINLALNSDSTMWEMEFVLLDTFHYQSDSVVKDMAAGDSVGFSIAYNDNDDITMLPDSCDCHRDNMAGWVRVTADNSWMDADLFGTLYLTNDTITVSGTGSIIPLYRNEQASDGPGTGGLNKDIYTIFGQKLPVHAAPPGAQIIIRNGKKELAHPKQ